MKHAKQILSLGMALALAIPVPVLAEDATINSNTTQDVKVTATVGSSFEVTIPKEITLTSDKTGTGTYTGSIPVTVKGDIGTNQLITVDTNDSVSLADSTEASTEAITATITKDETEFDFNTLTGGQTATANHSVSANLTPGTWEGTATFSINLGVPEIKYEQLLFSWSPSEGYETYTSDDGVVRYVRLTNNDYLTVDEVANGVKLIYTTTDGAKKELICTEDNLGLSIDEENGLMVVELIQYANVFDYTLAQNYDKNGMYLYLGGNGLEQTKTINGVEYVILTDCTIEIYGPSK